MYESMPAVLPIEAAERTFVQRVFGWMGGGLALTGVIALAIGSSDSRIAWLVGSKLVWVAMIGSLLLVFGIRGAVNKLSATRAAAFFLAYSALNGVWLSVLFAVYTKASIATTFFACAGTFGASAFYGAVAKKDLTSFGGYCGMGLIGIVIASVLNLFLRSPALYWAVSYVGVFVFIGLTAYDMQQIKQTHRNGIEGGTEDRALAINGALRLYLDFLNLFLLLLRFLGNRRS